MGTLTETLKVDLKNLVENLNEKRTIIDKIMGRSYYIDENKDGIKILTKYTRINALPPYHPSDDIIEKFNVVCADIKFNYLEKEQKLEGAVHTYDKAHKPISNLLHAFAHEHNINLGFLSRCMFA